MQSSLSKALGYLAKSIAVGFFILTIVLTVIAFAKPEWFTLFIDWMGGIVKSIGNWNYLVIFLASSIESLPFIGTAVPGQNILIITAGFWAPEHELFSILSAIIGALIGNASGYYLWVKAGEELLAKYGILFGVGIPERDMLMKTIGNRGGWTIALGKFHNFFRAFLPFIAGTANLAPRAFWLWNILGSVVWAVAMVYLGIAVIDNYQLFLKYLGWVILAVFIIGGLIIYKTRPDLVREYMKSKQVESDELVKRFGKKSK